MAYDESRLVRRLGHASWPGRVRFAASAAERLLPLCRRAHEVAGVGDPDTLTAALDLVWGAGHVGELTRWQSALRDPVGDAGWIVFAQHGVAAVRYAVRTALSGSAQEAAWAARQVYEAADQAAMLQRPDLDLRSFRAEAELLASPVVREALGGIDDDLLAMEDESPAVRAAARAGGARLVLLAGL